MVTYMSTGGGDGGGGGLKVTPPLKNLNFLQNFWSNFEVEFGNPCD